MRERRQLPRQLRTILREKNSALSKHPARLDGFLKQLRCVHHASAERERNRWTTRTTELNRGLRHAIIGLAIVQWKTSELGLRRPVTLRFSKPFREHADDQF